MSYISLSFLLLIVVSVILYYIIPKRSRKIYLLILSLLFCLSYNPTSLIFLLAYTIISHLGGILLSKINNLKKKKTILIIFLVIIIGGLCFYKYADFLVDNLNSLLGFKIKSNEYIVPIGLSFYSFKIMGYLIDVYQQKLEAETKLLDYYLYIIFFPCLIAGPIEKTKNLLKQIKEYNESFNADINQVINGIIQILWGFFAKTVIADRIAILVNQVVNNYGNYGFVEISTALLLYAIEIYCDFAGYSDISIGIGKLYGFDLVENFKQPYFSTSLKDFWRKWHISLNSWFTQYIYIPLGGNRKGQFRKYLNITIVFVVSGIWHGASMNYVAWGLIHAFYEIVEDLIIKDPKKESKGFIKWIKRIVVFLLVDFAWLFFVSSSLKNAINTILQMFKCFKTTGILSLGLGKADFKVLIISIVMLFVIDLIKNKNQNFFNDLVKDRPYRTIIVCFILVWLVLLFGVYGASYNTSGFAYARF